MVKGWALRTLAVSGKDLTRGALQTVGHCSVCHHAAGTTKGYGKGLGPNTTSSMRQRLARKCSAKGGSLSCLSPIETAKGPCDEAGPQDH
jgi:hypothetical protein